MQIRRIVDQSRQTRQTLQDIAGGKGQTRAPTDDLLVEYLPLHVHRRAAKRGGAQEAPTRSHFLSLNRLNCHHSPFTSSAPCDIDSGSEHLSIAKVSTWWTAPTASETVTIRARPDQPCITIDRLAGPACHARPLKPSCLHCRAGEPR